MAQPYIGEVRMFAGNFAPTGWMFCNGQVVPISENDALFNLIGTTYGGDGVTVFALPDLRGRIPIHFGDSFILAETGGAEEVALTEQHIPSHSHPLRGTNRTATRENPGGNFHAQFPQANVFPYTAEAPNVNMAASVIAPVGGSQPHANFQPYLCVSFIISMFGIFPPRN